MSLSKADQERRFLKVVLDTEHTITADNYCFILYRERRVKSGRDKGEIRQDALGFYATLGQLLRGYRDELVRMCGAESITELQAALARIDDTIRTAAEKLGSVDLKRVD